MSAPTPPTPQNRPAVDPRRDVERDRMLTLANVQRMRGQFEEAGATLQKALALGDGESRADAPIHELLGDILAGYEKWEEAKKAYGTAHALDPDRASAERKFAQMTLRLADAAREREMADAILRGEMPISGGGAFNGGTRGKRSPAVAMLLSGLVPGFGQLYNGQLVKGLICLGIFFLTLLVIRLSPDADLLFRQTLGIFFGGVGGVRGQVSPFLWLLTFVSVAVWLYSLLDAPMVAAKTGSDDAGPGAPKPDKSGWEV